MLFLLIKLFIYLSFIVACCVCVWLPSSEFCNIVIVNVNVNVICFYVVFTLLLYLLLQFNHLIWKREKQINETNDWNKMFSIHLCSFKDITTSKAVNKTSKCIKLNNLIFCCALVVVVAFFPFGKIFHIEKLANDKHINNKPIEKWTNEWKEKWH